jgi:hypothetical protein
MLSPRSVSTVIPDGEETIPAGVSTSSPTFTAGALAAGGGSSRPGGGGGGSGAGMGAGRGGM